MLALCTSSSIWLALPLALAGMAVLCSSASGRLAAPVLARALRKRLLPDPEVVVRKGASYTALAAAIAALWIAMVVAVGRIFDMPAAAESIPLNAAFIAAMAMLFRPLRARMLAFVGGLIYRGRLDRRQEIRAAASDVLRTMSRKALALRLAGKLASAMRGPPVSLLLTSKDGRSFERIALSAADGTAKYFDPPEPCEIAAGPAELLLSGLQVVAAWDSPDGIRAPGSAGPGRHECGPVLAVPLIQKDRLSGALLVGPPFQGPFTSEDAELLQICANQAAVAFENSALFEQVLDMKDYYDSIIESMTTGLLTFGIDGRLNKINRAGCGMLGLDHEPDRGAAAEDVFRSVPDLKDMIAGCLAAPEAPHSDREVAVPGDRGTILSATVSPIRDLQGNPAGAALLMADVTARKELETRLERSRRLAYMGELASGVAHEIKNPLGSIRLFVESLDDDFDDPALRSSFVDLVLPEIDGLDSMLKDLMDYSRPSHDQGAECDAAALLATALDLMAPDLRRNRVDVRNLAEKRGLVVPCDGERLKRAFANVIVNAIESFPESGDRVVAVSACAKAGKADITISDTGLGIPQENLLKIFKPFFTTKSRGTGLGLPMAQKVVEECGGAISVSSVPGKGTTVSILLPLKGGCA